MITVRKRPCTSCPYRRDVPSGIWDESEYDKLPQYDGGTIEQVTVRATALFFCHQRTGDLCAGWVGCHDMDTNLAVRMNAASVDPEIYDYSSPVPLFASGAEAAEHGRRDHPAPGPEAKAKISQLRRLKAAQSKASAVMAGEEQP